MNKTTLSDSILEQTTPKITAVVRDADLNPIPGSSLLTLTLTLYSMSDPPTHAIINSRNAQDVLGVNGGSVDASGNLAWQTVSADTAMQDSALSKETHRAVFKWTYLSGADTLVGSHIIDMTVVNLEKVV